MIKVNTFIMMALIPLFVLANTPGNFDRPVSDTSAIASTPQNLFILKYVDVNSGRNVSNPLNVAIDDVYDNKQFSITDGADFIVATTDFQKNIPSTFINVIAESKKSTSTVNWLKKEMSSLGLSKTDIVNTKKERQKNIGDFPTELDFVFKTVLYIYPPNSKEEYACEDVMMAKSGSIWWMAGNTPNPSVNQSGLKPYQYLPIIDCESTKSSSTLRAYVGATSGSVDKNVMILNYRINN
jgi:hypothetical protein